MIPNLPGKALRTAVDIARLAELKRILGEFRFTSKALRTLVDIWRLAETWKILGECYHIKFTRQGFENAC